MARYWARVKSECSEIIYFEEGHLLSWTDTKRGKKKATKMYSMSSSIMIAFVVIFSRGGKIIQPID